MHGLSYKLHGRLSLILSLAPQYLSILSSVWNIFQKSVVALSVSSALIDSINHCFPFHTVSNRTVGNCTVNPFSSRRALVSTPHSTWCLFIRFGSRTDGQNFVSNSDSVRMHYHAQTTLRTTKAKKYVKRRRLPPTSVKIYRLIGNNLNREMPT